MDESTQEILDGYMDRTNDSHRILRRPSEIAEDLDITTYEEDDFDVFSDRNNRSIEYGRGVSVSPLKARNPLHFSNHLSPIKAHLDKLRNGSPGKRADMSELDLSFGLRQPSFSDNTIDREIKHFVGSRGRKIPAPAVFDDLDLGAEEDGKLLIENTHKLIKLIPNNISSSAEFENYQLLLKSSTAKLVRRLRQEVDKNQALTAKIGAYENRVKKQADLEMEVRSLRSANADLRRQNDELRLQDLVPDPLLARDNELLRQKLVKYKGLYEESVKRTSGGPPSTGKSESEKIAPQSTPSEHLSANQAVSSVEKLVAGLSDVIQQYRDGARQVSEGGRVSKGSEHPSRERERLEEQQQFQKRQHNSREREFVPQQEHHFQEVGNDPQQEHFSQQKDHIDEVPALSVRSALEEAFRLITRDANAARREVCTQTTGSDPMAKLASSVEAISEGVCKLTELLSKPGGCECHTRKGSCSVCSSRPASKEEQAEYVRESTQTLMGQYLWNRGT